MLSVEETTAADSARARLQGLDTLRAIAILLVMGFHLNAHLPEVLQTPWSFGWIGVDLFFVLSGFLIGSQLLRPYAAGHAPSFAGFYRKRAYRILPAFTVVLLLYVFVPVWREAPGMQPWWQFASFTENFLIDYGHNRAFSHVWSLCVEEHFYLVLPLLTAALMRRPRAWKVYATLALLVCAGLLLRAYVVFHVLRRVEPDVQGLAYLQRLYYPTYTRLDGLIAGVALALARTFRPAWWAAAMERGHSFLVGGLAALGVALWFTPGRNDALEIRGVLSDVLGYPLLALGFALLTASAVSRNGWLARWRVPGAHTLAVLSFSLYLTHKEAVHMMRHRFPELPDQRFASMPIDFAACLLVAAALYFGVERPFLKLRDRRQKRSAAVPIDVQAALDPAL